MGGKNPQIVLDDADLKVAVELCAQSAFYSTGQRCTASSRIIVTEGIYDRFVEAMIERISKIKVGPALEQGVDVGPVVSWPSWSRTCATSRSASRRARAWPVAVSR